MKRFIVRLQLNAITEPELLEMPGETAVSEILTNLIKALALPTSENGQPVLYWIEIAPEQPLRDADTLTSSAIRNDQLLWLRSGGAKPIAPQPAPSSEAASGWANVGDSASSLPTMVIERSGPVRGFKRLRMPRADGS